jgi:hypothetical protein
MAKNAQLILFVHGMSAKQRGEHLGKLLGGLAQFALKRNLELRAESDGLPAAEGSRRYDLVAGPATRRRIDVREVFWSDLRPQPSNQSVLAKFAAGSACCSIGACPGASGAWPSPRSTC